VKTWNLMSHACNFETAARYRQLQFVLMKHSLQSPHFYFYVCKEAAVQVYEDHSRSVRSKPTALPLFISYNLNSYRTRQNSNKV
jgi:hypothetical protein